MGLGKRNDRSALGAFQAPRETEGRFRGALSALRKNYGHAGTLPRPCSFVGTGFDEPQCPKQSRTGFIALKCQSGRGAAGGGGCLSQVADEPCLYDNLRLLALNAGQREGGAANYELFERRAIERSDNQHLLRHLSRRQWR